MKYFVFILVERQDDAIGVTKSWHLIKPHEMPKYRHSTMPDHMRYSYNGFNSLEEAIRWIDEYGEKYLEYSIMPIYKLES